MLELEPDTHIFAGLSRVRYNGEPFDLGNGVMLRSAYAHLFAAPMMAFRRAAPGQAHPPPWRAVKGGFAWDIEVEIAVPLGSTLPAGFDAEQVARLIATLLRLSRYAYLMMPVVSDHAFSGAAIKGREPLLRPVEVEGRIVTAGSPAPEAIRPEDLNWVRSVWPRTAELLKKNRQLADALEALDACTVNGRTSSALLLAWGALEELFAPGSRSEIRFRVASNLATFLEAPGPGRLKMFTEVKELYDARSAAAHTSRNSNVEHLLRTFVLLRNALLKIITDSELPTAQQFNEALYLGKEF
jgi:hypothetical protein